MRGTSLLRYRIYDLDTMGLEPLCRLYGKVYGDAQPLRTRLKWELQERPDKADVAVYTVWAGDELVGMTVRLPCPLVIGGETVRACFAVDTMVAPEYQGRGVVRELYAMASCCAAVQLSKGTAPGMYQALLKMGYRKVVPDNYQVCLLAPLKWLAGKVHPPLYRNTTHARPEGGFGEFEVLARFDAGQEALVSDCLAVDFGGVVKSLESLNWRYVDIPHRIYHRFVRKVRGRSVSMLVLRLAGMTAYLVDLRWTPQCPDEPAASIGFARRFSRRMGAIKLVSWGTLGVFRAALERQFFFNVSDTPRFSYYPVDERFQCVDWSKIHLVHGDGDTEYL
ncbi:MAG: GNAT family N-acetyltransferase [Geobacter sp.]|nr:MAG: GNAT family N-acetyltransferase [Geobacter sp.]